jgi:V8-like Glu-specific endopeptidase
LACGPQPAPPEEENIAPIIGGEPDSADSSVVAVYGRSARGGFLCTGSIIAPTVVLTAAHCVSPSEAGTGAQFVVLTRPNLQAADPGALEVREVHANPLWSADNLAGGHDQGVVILSQPTDLRPLPFNRRALASGDVGKQVRIVGYGATDGATQTGAGRKRDAVTTLQAVDRNLIAVGTTAHGTCNGDSGGPIFMDVGGTETIIATTSFGNQSCTDGGYDARVDTDLGFLARYLPATCAPACSGRSCGGDGCGGSCGDCADGEMCSAAGRCSAAMGGCGPSEVEPNDSALQANPLCVGGTIRGALSSAEDNDWFSFQVVADADYEIDLAGGPTAALARVYKQASSGRLTFVAEGRTVSRHTTTGGNYLARVMDGDGSAGYRLTFRSSR